MKFSKEPSLKREPRLSEQVADFLAAEIEIGSLRPGEPLPSEAELSYRFNVSRAVIREALARLKQQGILESRQGSRTRVTNGCRRVFRFHQEGGDRRAEIACLYELKVLMEGDAAALAAIHRTDRDIENLRACLKTLKCAMDKGLDGTSANFDFHQMVIEASHNRYLIDFMKFLNERLWDLLAEEPDQPSNLRLTPNSFDEHVQLYEAIARKSPEQAREALYVHLKNAAERRGIDILAARSIETAL